VRLQSDYGRLNGFTLEAGRCHEFFHQQARKYLVEVGTALARAGVARVRIQRLTALMGSSGGVCAEFRVPGQDAYLEVTVSTAPAVASRSDGVVISAWGCELWLLPACGVGRAELCSDLYSVKATHMIRFATLVYHMCGGGFSFAGN
jgi:hypothetical protein